MHSSKHRIIAAVSCGLVLALDAGAQNLVNNGGFGNTSPGTNKQLGFNTNAVGWATNTNSFVLVYTAAAADSSGASSQYGNVSLWGSNNGGLNNIIASPNGGNFIAADGSFTVSGITQTLSGLTVGNQYDVSFYMGAAQERGYYGNSTESWEVSLGGQTISSASIALPSQGFSGWIQQTLTFTADSASPVLKFLAIGAPSAAPAYSLLDGVSVVAVPEPSTCLVGSILLCGMALRRKRSI